MIHGVEKQFVFVVVQNETIGKCIANVFIGFVAFDGLLTSTSQFKNTIIRKKFQFLFCFQMNVMNNFVYIIIL